MVTSRLPPLETALFARGHSSLWYLFNTVFILFWDAFLPFSLSLTSLTKCCSARPGGNSADAGTTARMSVHNIKLGGFWSVVTFGGRHFAHQVQAFGTSARTSGLGVVRRGWRDAGREGEGRHDTVLDGGFGQRGNLEYWHSSGEASHPGQSEAAHPKVAGKRRPYQLHSTNSNLPMLSFRSDSQI
jgi:hypothetical protein